MRGKREKERKMGNQQDKKTANEDAKMKRKKMQKHSEGEEESKQEMIQE